MNASVYKRFVFVLLIPFFAGAANYIFNVLLSHLLKNDLYGDFIIGLKTMTVCSCFILLGTARTSKLFLSLYLHLHDERSETDYIHWNIHLIAKSAVIFIALLIGLLGLMLFLHVFEIKDFRSYHLAFYMAFLSPLAASTLLLTTYLQCNNNIFLYNISTQSGRYVAYILVLLIASYTFSPNFNTLVLWYLSLTAFTILNLTTITLSFLFLPRAIFHHIMTLKNFYTAPTETSPIWKKISTQFIISDNLFTLLCLVDIYAVKFLAPTAFAINQYAAILSVSCFAWIISNAVLSYLDPVIAPYIKESNYAGLQKAVNQSTLINLLTSSVVTILIIYFSNDILKTFGAPYLTETTKVTLIILSIGTYIGTFSKSANSLLALSDKQAWLIYINTLELVLILVLSIILTWWYGIIGTAIATTLAISIKTIAFTIVSYRTMPIKLFILA